MSINFCRSSISFHKSAHIRRLLLTQRLFSSELKYFCIHPLGSSSVWYRKVNIRFWQFYAWVGGFIPSIIFCFWMNISLREFKWASRSSSFMSLAEGSEMALVTLSAVAEMEIYIRKLSLKDQIITSLVFPHLDESLHLGDPLLDGLVHRLPPLDVGSVHLVRLQEQKR